MTFDEFKETPVIWTHRWAWRTKPADRDRSGMLCCVLGFGALGSVRVLYEDGIEHVTSRRGLRRLPKETP